MAPEIQPIKPSIRFFDPAIQLPEAYLYAIILSRFQSRWIWVRHKERSTWELPAGHIEIGETPEQAAHRELFEETGALIYRLEPVVSYEGVLKGKRVYGMLFFAEISELGPLPEFEIGEIAYFAGIPELLTYPEIQPVFFNYILKEMDEKGFNDLTALPNIGISLAESLMSAGITNPKELIELGTEKTFLRLQAADENACISQLYAIEGAIAGVRWHSLDNLRREELRLFYNQLNPSSL